MFFLGFVARSDSFSDHFCLDAPVRIAKKLDISSVPVSNYPWLNDTGATIQRR